ncbi:hypothetical protein D3C77_310260 [compost metagenome]
MQTIEAVIEVFAKDLFQHALLQVAVGRTDHPYIQLAPCGAAQAGDFTFLQHPQQPGLQGRRHIANFIQQQRAAMGRFQLAAGAAFARTGEGTFDIAEQLGFDQAFRNGRTVDRNERGLGVPMLMQGPGEHFFARSGFALQQNRDTCSECFVRAVQLTIELRVCAQRRHLRGRGEEVLCG